MNALDALLTRRTIHEFVDTPLPEGAVRTALGAAIRAPNHKLTNPWRFTLVGAHARKAYVDVATEIKFGVGYTEKQRDVLSKKMETSPGFLVVSQVIDADPRRRQEDYASVACAIQNFSLALWAQGIGSKWSTSPAIRDVRVYDVMGIDPSVEEIVGVVFVGYPAKTPDTPRREIDEVLRHVD